MNIAEAEYGIDFRLTEPIDEAESSVYIGRDRSGKEVVLKVYDGYRAEIIDEDVLRRYAALTDQVKIVCEQSAVMKADLGYELEIVPILRIGRLKIRGSFCSVSKFVPGDNLRDAKINVSVKYEILQQIEKINRYLQQRFEEKGIRIDSLNVKLNEEEKKLAVTDICGVVAVLSPHFYGYF